jgi:hypothetical protein
MLLLATFLFLEQHVAIVCVLLQLLALDAVEAWLLWESPENRSPAATRRRMFAR